MSCPRHLVAFAAALTAWGLPARVDPTFGSGFRVLAGPSWNTVELLRRRGARLEYLWFRSARLRPRDLRDAIRGALREPRYGRFLLDMRALYRPGTEAAAS